jgi:hypothetical protein
VKGCTRAQKIMQRTIMIADRGHKNRDVFSQGPRSAILRSRRGDNHFRVIRCHKSNGAVCSLIWENLLQLNSRMRYTFVYCQIILLS